MNNTKVLCTKCGKEDAEWDYGNEQLCQMCFEDDCDRAFWKAVEDGWVF